MEEPDFSAVPRRRGSARGRDRVAALLHRAPLRRANRAPLYVRSVVEAAHRPSIASHLGSIRTVASPVVQPFDPNHLGGLKLLPAGLTTVFPEVLEVVVGDCLVDPATGAVFTPESLELLGESYGSFQRTRTWGSVPKPNQRVRPLPETIGNTIIPMPDTGYYHWLVEVLPSVLHSLNAAEKPLLLVHPSARRYVQQAAEVLGVPVIAASTVVRAERVMFTSRPPVSGEAHPHNLLLLRAYAAGYGRTDWDGPLKVYVSRRSDPARHVASEQELEAVALDHGYDVVLAQDLDWPDQISLFANVESIAGLHGAGLANIALGSNLKSVVELFPNGLRNWCYLRAATSLGLHYQAMSYEGGPESCSPFSELLGRTI